MRSPQETPSRRLTVYTADGWQLALWHYRGVQVASKQPPILLCHGLNANRLTFDTHPDYSFTAWLMSQGRDVYAIELRGHGGSERPTTNKPWGWGFNDYAERDLPATIAAVISDSGCDQIDFIGHSMGGILLYALACSDQAPHIRAGITLGSSLNYHQSPSIFRWIAPLAPATHLVPLVPLQWPAQLSGKLSKLSTAFMDTTLVCPENMDTTTYQRLVRFGTHAVSGKVLRDMARAIDGRGMQDSQGRSYQQQLQQNGYPFPILAVAGTRDTQCPPAVAARFGTQWLTMGRNQGHRVDYGHHDLICGRNAPVEVWPQLLHWLEEN